MSTVTEREEITTPAGETCEAIIDIFGIGLPCIMPSAGLYRRICVHEHVREGRMCLDHAAGRARLCKTCAELDGGLSHECPISVAEVTP